MTLFIVIIYLYNIFQQYFNQLPYYIILNIEHI